MSQRSGDLSARKYEARQVWDDLNGFDEHPLYQCCETCSGVTHTRQGCIPPLRGDWCARHRHKLFGHHPFAWKATPPGGLRTQKVSLCALFCCVRLFGTICPETITELICFEYLRCKNYVTAPENNSPRAPRRQELRYGNL